VEPDVVLEGVDARHVVVVGVLEPEDQPTALVDLTRDRLALHRKPEVLHLRSSEGDRKAVVGSIGVGLDEDVLSTGRIVNGLNHPLPGRPLSRPPERETLGWLTGL